MEVIIVFAIEIQFNSQKCESERHPRCTVHESLGVRPRDLTCSFTLMTDLATTPNAVGPVIPGQVAWGSASP